MRNGIVAKAVMGLVTLALAAPACGGSGSGMGTPGQPGTTPDSILPKLAMGAQWTYAVTGLSGPVGQKTTAVEALEDVGGIHQGTMAYRVHGQLADASVVTWEQVSGTSVVAYREQQFDAGGTMTADKSYEPSVLVVDESPDHLAAGATWIETYDMLKPSKKGTSKPSRESVTWTVDATDESITVPAGTFTAVHLSRKHTTSKTPSDEKIWYARGVGKVKHTGAGPNNDETLELVSFTAP